MPEQIRSPNPSPLPFLASTPDPSAAVVVGLSSELLCGVTFALAVLAFPFLSFLEVSLGTSAMSLWSRNVYVNLHECHATSHSTVLCFLYFTECSLNHSASPLQLSFNGSLPGRRKDNMVFSGLRPRMKPRKKDATLLQVGYGKGNFKDKGTNKASVHRNGVRLDARLVNNRDT